MRSETLNLPAGRQAEVHLRLPDLEARAAAAAAIMAMFVIRWGRPKKAARASPALSPQAPLAGSASMAPGPDAGLGLRLQLNRHFNVRDRAEMRTARQLSPGRGPSLPHLPCTERRCF